MAHQHMRVVARLYRPIAPVANSVSLDTETLRRALGVLITLTHQPNFTTQQGTQQWIESLASKTESQRLDLLVGKALTTPQLKQALVPDCDEDILLAFGLQASTRQWLQTQHYNTFNDLVGAICQYQREYLYPSEKDTSEATIEAQPSYQQHDLQHDLAEGKTHTSGKTRTSSDGNI